MLAASCWDAFWDASGWHLANSLTKWLTAQAQEGLLEKEPVLPPMIPGYMSNGCKLQVPPAAAETLKGKFLGGRPLAAFIHASGMSRVLSRSNKIDGIERCENKHGEFRSEVQKAHRESRIKTGN